MQVDFVKMEGAGNDFIMLDGRNTPLPEKDFSGFAARCGDRKRGIGSDGLLVLLPAGQQGFDFTMRFFNPDGSEAEMCGNGARCISLFAHNLGITGKKMRFSTNAGPVSAEITKAGVKLHMPSAPAITNVPGLDVAGKKLDVFFTNTGVPHAVVVMDDLDNVDIKTLGSAIRYHNRFKPAGTNANFIKSAGGNKIILRTYERGVEDETLACGTGACASALVASKVFGMKSPVSVLTRGNDTLVIYFKQAKDGSFPEVFLEGPAREVFRGTVPW
jgi:diaminopimelate epimerase